MQKVGQTTWHVTTEEKNAIFRQTTFQGYPIAKVQAVQILTNLWELYIVR